ncbi:RNA polymerase sigma factor [Streptomyces sp. SCL15-6]|uniref:RNA polymerase sigma factor n=1 Tax=Streptomyces sp. SCL15-6 TaxID=2967222 RepID=UPI00398F8EC4
MSRHAPVDGYPVNEISDLLSIPAGTVKSRLSAARKDLRDSLGYDFREGGTRGSTTPHSTSTGSTRPCPMRGCSREPDDSWCVRCRSAAQPHPAHAATGTWRRRERCCGSPIPS